MGLSRRTFTALAGVTALGFTLGGSIGTPTRASSSRSVPTGPAPGPPAADGRRHTVGFDRHSLLIDGRRLVLWSGEMHPFRLPSPSLWRDVLEKMRAHGYNAVSAYVSWNYHSAAPGRYDFTGVRDLDLFLRTAAETGLYVILRPGPYINAEIDGGGFPGWLTVTEGRARTSDPTYLKYADEWLTEVNAIAARHQYTRGTGTVLLYQIENEYDSYVGEPAGRDYMSHLYKKVRADGIDVPLFHNDKGRNGHWTPGSFDTGGEKGRWLYGFDGYPSPSQVPADWGYFGTGGAKGGATASPRTPGFVPEFGGGWFDPWGGSWFRGKGYAESRRTRDAAYERRFYLTNLANGITLHNVYMTFGGTSWGWLPAPVVYTSYDYGAAFDEGRNATPKLAPMHQIGHLLARQPDFAKLNPATAVKPKDDRLTAYHLTNPDTGAHVYVLRNDSAEPVTSELPGTDFDVPLTVPARDGRLLATGLGLGQRKLKYSTVQPMMCLTVARQDIAVFAGPRGEMAQVVLDCPQEPTTTRLDAEGAWVYDRGLLRVSAPLGTGGLTRVKVEAGGAQRPMLLFFADDATSLRLWPVETPSGPVLVYGPALVRSVTVRGDTVALTGDTIGATGLEVWGPRGLTRVTWNGVPVRTRLSGTGSLLALQPLPGVPKVNLPTLEGGWRHKTENPESAPDFDDSAWKTADRKTSHSVTPVPEGQPVLFADDYGFHYGDVWYRGRFDVPPEELEDLESVSLAYSTGTQGLLMAWLDGEPLGTHRMPVPDNSTVRQGSWAKKATFTVPEDLRERVADRGDAHALSVLVRRMQHDQDGKAQDSHKVARGLTGVAFKGVSPKVRWRLQGEAAVDPVRGPQNNGGLYGEREGWHLPGFADAGWERTGLPRAGRRQGVTWYRRTFRLAVEPGIDASVGLTLADDPARAYRVQIFLNGWNMGQYINDVGPQHTFVLPNGILRTRGTNTLALAVLSDGTTESGPEDVRLTLLGSAAGGVPVTAVDSPGR
ncbi:beta-galactosidase [Streptomyces lincolnensis]|uniref:beta-galactosidase n=1 Tax=Streptomyces lincolnensis TaxID=1915 RepID=A0A1B1M936_STRLN|nr:beta-galactosidase [Streptomyces lincolnensis]ANS64993.1 beta-galactosidase [Streptomyces lincolnensis]AXG56799.1 beta-galactosidase [Streptomyces lincolnensis]QMV06786.1 cellulase family glycosylhydrolase [Streptomyces lincolnensis]